MAIQLDTPVQFIKGVGPKFGDIFARKGIKTVKDLIEFFPRAYEDQRAARNIASLKADEIVSLKAQVVGVHSIPMGRSKRRIYDVSIRDSSGTIHCKYFRTPYKGYFERLSVGKSVRVVGKVTLYRGRLEFHHPDIRDDEAETEIRDTLIPLYTEIEGVSTTRISKLITSAYKDLSNLPDFPPKDTLPEALRNKYSLLTRWKALEELHQPPQIQAESFMSMDSKAHRRFIFEEFFWLELFLASRKTNVKRESAPKLKAGSKEADFRRSLPFKLTGAQERALQEIQQDLASGKPMNRLVQGDVGSGKTMVAFLSALTAFENGYQSVMMAPTEILAEQHAKNAAKFLEPMGVRIVTLVGKTKASEKKEILERLAKGEIDFVMGTHAVIENDVQYKNLGLVIVDEQHRFGVEQRARLKSKGLFPHTLVMTATPIPRTLALTVYGDLDVSVIDELPPGRTPIQTRVTYNSKRNLVFDFVRDQVQKGRQAYVVYPLVEESEKIDLKNALEEYQKLKVAYPAVRWGLLHGRMKAAEKDQIMDEFRAQKLDVLVSTTVIEVGVDVPNANTMVVEHAERFGLSQLHQLRGRVGRGTAKSFCILVLGHAVSDEARERTQFMEQTSDGFKIAEFDLELRGPGEFLGTRQSGLAGFKMAHIVRHQKILSEARQAAFEVFQKDPDLKAPENKVLREELLKKQGPTALAGVG